MSAKVHKSLRLDSELVKRVELLKHENEPLSNAMCRVMEVGCNTLEDDEMRTRFGQEHDGNTAKIIALLEDTNARLVADNESYKAAIAEKDRQIVASLEKAHELAEQAHVLIGMTQKTEVLPVPDEPTDTEAAPADTEPKPAPAKIGFWDWFRNYR